MWVSTSRPGRLRSATYPWLKRGPATQEFRPLRGSCQFRNEMYGAQR